MYLGIDHSVNGTAIALLSSPSNYTTYLIKGKGANSQEKLLYTAYSIRSIVHEQMLNIKKVAIEGGSFRSDGHLYTLGQVSGAIIYALKDLKIIQVPPKTLKKFISGNGDAEKPYVMKKILEKYNIEFNDDNKADAYSLALFCYRLDNKEGTPFREELESVIKFDQHIKYKKIKRTRIKKKINL